MSSHKTHEYIQSLQRSQPLGDQVKAYHFRKGRDASFRPIPDEVSPALQRILHRLGLSRLYGHQLDAFHAIRNGQHVVVATPTASGKSLIYNLTMFDAVARDAHSRGLYVFPLKALTRDQLTNFRKWSEVDAALAPSAAVYDGDTSAYHRRKIRQNPPNVVMTNPEMVHLAMLAYHAKWSSFFENLKLVVVDEVHTYRGLMGSHMAQVLRRLKRICRIYGARPTFVFASATIANPAELSHQLTGLDVLEIRESGAPQGGRHMVMIDPVDGPARASILLLKAAMARELRTIVYTQSRKMAELISMWVQQQAGLLANRISVYRAGFKPEERRRIENDLKTGRLLAVVTTSALELGIDIGDLDICILSGYPGSMIATKQRSGRVGRKGQEAAMILLAGQDAMDQYYIANPDAFFKGRPEKAVVNPLNAVVLKAHLICAAAEQPIEMNEAWLSESGMPSAVAQMVASGNLMQSADGTHLHTHRKRPHLKVDLRSAGRRFRIYDKDELIGEINAFRLYRETHPGAVYLHRGQTYLIESVDDPGQVVYARKAQLDFHTRIRSDSDIEILDVEKVIKCGNTNICIGKVKVTDHVVGFERMHNRSGQKLGYIDLDVPPSVFESEGIWFKLAHGIPDRLLHNGFDLLGALHAAEHAVIGVMPLRVLADRNDLGGLATPFHPQTKAGTIFIYDGIPGGAGLSRQAYEQPLELLETAADAIDRCVCDEGCPACIHSSKCGSGNHPMDKHGGSFILRQIAEPGHLVVAIADTPQKVKPSTTAGNGRNVRKTRYGVFDLETQRSAQEVGGWHLAHKMKVSCGVIYDSADDAYTVYLENQMPQLIDHLKRMEVVVGFNSKRFDYKVLSAYTRFDFSRLNSFDLLDAVYHAVGFRLSLDHLAEQTLGSRKSGSGLDALRWWQEGRIDKIIAYCRKDVKITRDLYRFARDKGYLLYRQKDGQRFRIPMRVS